MAWNCFTNEAVKVPSAVATIVCVMAPPSLQESHAYRVPDPTGIVAATPRVCEDPIVQLNWTGLGVVTPSTVTGSPTGLVVAVTVATGKPGLRA